MSMHQIEDMIETTILLLSNCADTQINDIPLRDICYNLYQLQYQFDCGYTLLRAEEELVRMGFLVRIPIDLLPQQERDAAQRLTESKGFLPSGAYIDGKQLAYAAYGEPIWNTLAETGVISQPKMDYIPEMDALDLAEAVVPLAAEQRGMKGKAGETAADALLYWYALLPIMMLATGCEGEGQEDRIHRLRDLAAVPGAFERADALWLTAELEDLETLADDLPSLSDWAEPYLQWREENGGAKDESSNGSFSEEDWVRHVLESIRQGYYEQAEVCAKQLSEPSQSIFRVNITLSFHTEQRGKEKPDPLPRNVMTLAEAENKLDELLSSGFPAAVQSQLHLHLSQCRFLMENWEGAVDSLDLAFIPALEVLDKRKETEEQRIQRAYLTAAYYKMLLMNLPKDRWHGITLLEGLLSLEDALKVMETTAIGDEATLEQCLTMALLLAAVGQTVEASAWLDLAEQKAPDKEEKQTIAALRDAVTKK